MNQLDCIFHALSDPTRREILARLKHGELSIGELAKPFEMSLPAVSKHIGILENSGLICRTRQKQSIICTLNHTAFREIDRFMAQYRRIWNQRLIKMESDAG